MFKSLWHSLGNYLSIMKIDSPKEPILESIVRESFLALGYSSPNPPVAALLTNTNQQIISKAHTQRTGYNHAEREAYRIWEQDKNGKESIVSGETNKHHLYVSLEPCSHFGRTAPCRDLILSKKPLSISVGSLDPNPLVSEKRNIQIYKDAGIEWQLSQELKDASRDFLEPFFTRIEKKRPKMVLKSVVSKEGNYASKEDLSQAISNSSSNQALSLLRAKVDCILVGPKTLRIDNPSLDFRIPQAIADTLTRMDSNHNLKSNSNTSSGQIISSSSSKEAFSKSFGFWQRLIAYAKDCSIWKEHFNQFFFYQPKRAFVVSESTDLHPNFYENQKKIQEVLFIQIQEYFKIVNEKSEVDVSLLPEVIFFVMSESNAKGNKDFRARLNELQGIPNSKFISIPNQNFAKTILSKLAELGVNLLLVEGGNLLYQGFYDVLESQDEILYIQSKNTSISSGRSPVFADKLKNEIYREELDSDTWKVFKKE